jgi:hypothetical protein
VTIRGPFAAVLLVLLFVSLAANFLVAGFVVARVNAGAGNDVERLVATAVRGFPPEIQRLIADTTRNKRPQLRAGLEAVQESRQKMFEAMRAQPFNQASLDTAFAEYRAATVALQKVGQDVVSQAVAQAAPDVRRRIKPPGASAQPAGPRLPST